MTYSSTGTTRKRRKESERGPLSLANSMVNIVKAYVSRNEMTVKELVDLVPRAYLALEQLGLSPDVPVGVPIPPAPLSDTVTPDYLISLEDGRRYQLLTGHLSARGMSPAQYREKWGLPDDYPMVASGYSRTRSQSIMAKMSK